MLGGTDSPWHFEMAVVFPFISCNSIGNENNKCYRQTSVVKTPALALGKEPLLPREYDIRKGRIVLSITTFRYMLSPSPLFNDQRIVSWRLSSRSVKLASNRQLLPSLRIH
jgi:hypothetical protein